MKWDGVRAIIGIEDGAVRLVSRNGNVMTKLYPELQELADEGHELPQLILDYRELQKLKSTYVDTLPLTVNRETRRIHTSFNQTGAATGRSERTCAEYLARYILQHRPADIDFADDFIHDSDEMHSMMKFERNVMSRTKLLRAKVAKTRT